LSSFVSSKNLGAEHVKSTRPNRSGLDLASENCVHVMSVSLREYGLNHSNIINFIALKELPDLICCLEKTNQVIPACLIQAMEWRYYYWRFRASGDSRMLQSVALEDGADGAWDNWNAWNAWSGWKSWYVGNS